MSVTDKIYNLIREMLREGRSRTLKMAEIVERCTAQGYKMSAIENCVAAYEELNVWQVNQKRDRVTFL